MYVCKIVTDVYVIICVFIDVDECKSEDLNECHEKANCSNTFGSYDCVCLPGYTGDGRTCTGILVILAHPHTH